MDGKKISNEIWELTFNLYVDKFKNDHPEKNLNFVSMRVKYVPNKQYKADLITDKKSVHNVINEKF